MIYWIGAHGAGNAGDTVIHYAMKNLFKSITSEELIPSVDWHETTDKTIEKYNQAQALLIAGGGLMISDTHPNKNSGWRWNISLEQLERITAPIIVFGIGYNRFRGQDDYGPVFYNHIRTLVQKARFFSLRELHTPLHDMDFGHGIYYQPCPATMLDQWREYEPYHNRLVFVPGMDRIELRHADIGGFYSRLDHTLKVIQRRGWEVIIACHINKDKGALKYLPGYEHVDLTRSDINGILGFYKTVQAAISMRLHGLVIPFGLGCKRLIPIDTHDKVSDFAASVGCEIVTEGRLDKIPDLVELVYDFSGVHENMAKITAFNLAAIRNWL